MARRLTQVGFGQFAYAQWLVDLVFLVCSLGATGVIGRYAAEYRTRPERLAALMVRWRPYACGLPVVASGAVLLGALLSDLNLGAAALSMLAVWTAAHGLWAMQTAALVGLQRFDLIFRASVLAAAFMLTGVLVLPLHGDDVGLLFGLMAVACGAAATVGISAVTQLTAGAVGFIEPGGWRDIRGYALNIWITALLWSLVWSRGEMPIVRAYLGDAGVAQYAAALTLFGGAIQGVMLALSGVAPQLTMLWGSGRRDEAIATARSVMDVQLMLCGAGALLLICLGPELVSLAFGDGYRQASAPLAIFAVGLLAMTVSSQNHVLQVATNARFSRNTMIFGLVLLFGAAIVLTPRYGLNGAAFARTGTMMLLSLVSLLVVTKHWGGGAVSTRNVIVVFVLVAASAIAAVSGYGSGLAFRVILLCITLALLALSIQDQHHRSVFLMLPRAMLLRLGKHNALRRTVGE